MQYIDIHGHYAWGIDDGMPNKDDARKALELAKQQGVDTIVATPHVVPGQHQEKDLLDLKERIKDLKELALSYGIEILEGCELFLNYECIDALDSKIYIPIENTHYLLCEFDVRKQLGRENEVEDFLYEIEMQKLVPVIAHVERYFKDGIDLERVKEFVESGYVIQVNASSLLGVHGKKVMANAYALIDNGLAHVVASDTHRCDGQRCPRFKETFDVLSKKYDYEVVRKLMYDNPLHIIENEDVEDIEVKKSFFKKLFKRR